MSVTPDLIRLADIELPLQPIGCSHRRFASVIARSPTIAGLRTQPLHSHQAGYAMPATGLAQFTQIIVNLAIAIDPTAFQPGVLDQPE